MTQSRLPDGDGAAPPERVFEVRDELGQPVAADSISIHAPTEPDLEQWREAGAERASGWIVVFGTLTRPQSRRAAAPDRSTVSGVTAEAILTQVSDAYRAVSSYQDRGVVRTSFHKDQTPNELLFRIWFVRPDAFRFEWRSHHPYEPLRHLATNHAIRSVGGTTTTWWEGDPEEPSESLSMAIAGATGVSSSSAHSVPRLLMPDDVGGFCLLNLERVTYEGTELFEGALCHVVRGVHPHGEPHELWVGTSDWLIRMIRTDDGDEEIHRDIVVNGAIAANVFTTSGSRGFA